MKAIRSNPEHFVRAQWGGVYPASCGAEQQKKVQPHEPPTAKAIRLAAEKSVHCKVLPWVTPLERNDNFMDETAEVALKQNEAMV